MRCLTKVFSGALPQKMFMHNAPVCLLRFSGKHFDSNDYILISLAITWFIHVAKTMLGCSDLMSLPGMLNWLFDRLEEALRRHRKKAKQA